jgi:hypothetical protein
MTGIPCVHACAAIWHSCKDAADYIDDFYSLEMYKKAYEPVIYPMPSEEQRIKTHHDMLEPPVARATPGRPKKLRKMGVDESRDLQNKFRIRKFGARMTCSNCKGKGHNKRACPMNMSQLSQKLPTPPPASVSFAIGLIILVIV